MNEVSFQERLGAEVQSGGGRQNWVAAWEAKGSIRSRRGGRSVLEASLSIDT